MADQRNSGRKRRGRDRAFWVVCGLAFALIVAPAVAVIASVFAAAAPDFALSLLTKTTAGFAGLQNAILGTLLLLAGVVIVVGIVGVGAGIWLAEFSPPKLGGVVRFASEVLSGMPSIVIGYVGYLALVIGLHWGYSLLAGVLALSVLVVPYVVKTTEVALRQVPSALREAAESLGLNRVKTMRAILLPPAVPGIVSGLIVALAISTGETAPLLFTANYSDSNPTLHLLHHSVGYLTVVTFNDVAQPSHKAQVLASAAGAVLLVMLLILIFLGRLVARRFRRGIERMSL